MFFSLCTASTSLPCERCRGRVRHRERVWARVLSLLYLAFCSAAAFAACDPKSYDQQLELTGLGTAYVDTLTYDGGTDSAELLGGLCFSASNDSGLSLTAPTMRVTKVSSAPTFVAEGANLTLGRYTLFAAELSGDADGVSLRTLSVASPQFSGTVARARYTPATGQTILTGVSLDIGSFHIESVSAGLTERTLVLQDAEASTCTCASGGIYTLRAPGVVIDLATGGVRVERGFIDILGVRIALSNNLRLKLDLPTPRRGPAPAAGVAVASPTVLGPGPVPAPVGTTIDEGAKVALPLQLLPWLLVEAGVAGLDPDHYLGIVSILKFGAELGRTGLYGALGRAGPGWRADALIRQRLAPNLELDLSTTNRLWDAVGNLHDVSLALRASRSLNRILSETADTLALSGQVFAALSQQTLSGVPVGSARLGASVGARYASAPTAAGVFSLETDTGLTVYPQGGGGADDLVQVGLRARPAWQGDFGPLHFGLSYEGRLVLGRSPFSAEFDALEPLSVVGGSVSWITGEYGLNASGRYAFILNTGVNPVRQLGFSATRIVYFGKIKNSSLFSAEFAGLLGPSDPDTKASVSLESAFDLEQLGVDVEVGMKTRYDLLPTSAGLKLLEFYGAFPVELPSLTLKPFLGLNVASLITGEPLPTVTGYGLELAFRSCCGTLSASYRFHDETVVTKFDFQLTPAASRQP